MFRYIVLGLLRDGKPRHGYALMKEYRQRCGVQLSTGNFYRELQRLVGAGWVETSANPPGADARRTPYAITSMGCAVFDGWMASPIGSAFGRYDDELSSRAAFVGASDSTLAQKLLATWREDLTIRLKLVARARESAAARDARETFDAYGLIVARNLKHLCADLEFIDEFDAAYRAWLSAALSRRGSRRVPAASSPRARRGTPTRRSSP